MIRDLRGINATRPIFSPADMNGHKPRICETKVAIETGRGDTFAHVDVDPPEMETFGVTDRCAVRGAEFPRPIAGPTREKRRAAVPPAILCEFFKYTGLDNGGRQWH